MITLKEIAKECGVSTVTVSNILNGKKNVSEETRKRVMEVVERTGYHPNGIARGLRSRKMHQIGIIAEDIAQFTTPGIIEGIMQHCEHCGYQTIVSNLRLYGRWSDTWYHNDEAWHSILDPALRSMRSFAVDGLIYIAGHARNINVFSDAFGIPSIMTYAYEQNPNITSVVLDDTGAAQAIVRYLIENGHRKIGMIAGIRDNIHTEKRVLGYQKALYEAGILFDPELVVYPGWEREDGYRCTDRILDKGVSAIFCHTDRIAGGVYARLSEKGLRPGEDISVVGFDNQDISEYFIPGLTTMELPLRTIGHRAAEILIRHIEEGESDEDAAAREIYIPLKFIERESVRRFESEERGL